MRVAISIAEHELEMGHQWFDWCIELGGTDNHSLLLIPASGVNIKDILPKADKAFGGRVSIIIDYEAETGDWQDTEPMRSAAGPNSSFRQVAWHFFMNKLGPYFWCELDCIPLKKDWLDRLESEYKACGKVFMGAHVEIESVPVHMSGNGIYFNVPEEAPTLVQRTEWTPKGQTKSFELAFDIAGAREVIPKAHFTNLIQHKFRYEGFKSRKQFDEVIDPNAVVFHSCKDGSIYKYLRGEQDNLSAVPVLAEPQGTPEVRSGEARENTDNKTEVALPSDSRGGTQSDISERLKTAIKSKAMIEVFPKAVENRTYSYSGILERAVDQPSGLPPVSEPWKNKTESEQEVRLLCSALALFAKAPIYKARVRQALREAKIIK